MSGNTPRVATNWLQEVDEWARQRGPAQTWLQYPYFVFLRYPKLRPSEDPEMLATIRRCAQDILRRIQDLGVLDGMTEEHRLEFGALVFDLDADWKDEEKSRRPRGEVAMASKEVERRGRMLSRKIGKVVKTLNELADYIEKLEVDTRGRKRSIYATLIRRRVPSSKSIRELVQQVQSWQPETTLEDLKSNHPDDTRRDISGKAADRLHAYLVEVCGCSSAEADIRTARIGNELWDWDVEVREHYAGADKWRGAQAIRHRRGRSRTGK